MAISNSTTRISLKTLGKSIINRLENKKFIEIDSGKRTDLYEMLFKLLSKHVLTDEDLTDRVRNEISTHSDAIADQNLTETAAFQSRKKQLREQLGEHEMHGFYFQDSMRTAVLKVCSFLLESPLIEEVYEADDILQKSILDTIQNFDENKIS